MLWSAPELIMVMRSTWVFLQLMQLQSILNAAARLIGASQSFPIALLSSEPPFTGFIFVNESNLRFAPSWETVLVALLHNTSRLTVSQFLLYLVVPPFGLRLGATCSPDTNVYDSVNNPATTCTVSICNQHHAQTAAPKPVGVDFRQSNFNIV